MGDGVDDCFTHGFVRESVLDLAGGCAILWRDLASNLGHHEVHGLIHLVKDRALVNLVRRNRLADFRAVEMSALGFGARHKMLRLLAEQQQGGVCRFALFQQVQVGESLVERRVLRERELPFATSGFRNQRRFSSEMSANEASRPGVLSKGRVRNKPRSSRKSTKLAYNLAVRSGTFRNRRRMS